MNSVLVEANPYLIADLKRVRPYDTIIEATVTDKANDVVSFIISRTTKLSSLDPVFISSWTGEGAGTVRTVSVKAIRINELMNKAFPDAPPLYMSIDTEGMDLHILKDMDFSRYPSLYPAGQPSERYIPGNIRQIIDYMAEQNYTLLAQTDVNLVK